MIPEIGLMIGMYIVTRMLSFITRKDQRVESSLVKVFAFITIVGSIIIIADLLVAGSKQPQIPHMPGF
jgi:formate-dependent nitrite reductase membrane component NrfD